MWVQASRSRNRLSTFLIHSQALPSIPMVIASMSAEDPTIISIFTESKETEVGRKSVPRLRWDTRPNGMPNPSTFVTGGLAVTADGTKIVIANVYNDSISIVDVAGRSVIKEIDLRPGVIDPAQNGVPGGEYPFWVAIKGNDTAYVSSLRDREIVVVDINSTPAVIGRIKAKGNPNKMILNRAQNLLFAAEDNSDLVEVVNTQTNQVVQSFATTGPQWVLGNVGRYRGSIP